MKSSSEIMIGHAKSNFSSLLVIKKEWALRQSVGVRVLAKGLIFSTLIALACMVEAKNITPGKLLPSWRTLQNVKFPVNQQPFTVGLHTIKDLNPNSTYRVCSYDGDVHDPKASGGKGSDGILVFGEPVEVDEKVTHLKDAIRNFGPAVPGETPGKVKILEGKTILANTPDTYVKCVDVGGVKSLSFAAICAKGLNAPKEFLVSEEWCRGTDGLAGVYVWVVNVDTFFEKPDTEFLFLNHRTANGQRITQEGMQVIRRKTPAKYELCGNFEAQITPSADKQAYKAQISRCDVYQVLELKVFGYANGRYRLLKQ